MGAPSWQAGGFLSVRYEDSPSAIADGLRPTFRPWDWSAFVHLQTPLALALEGQGDAGGSERHGHTTQTEHGRTGLG